MTRPKVPGFTRGDRVRHVNDPAVVGTVREVVRTGRYLFVAVAWDDGYTFSYVPDKLRSAGPEDR